MLFRSEDIQAQEYFHDWEDVMPIDTTENLRRKIQLTSGLAGLDHSLGIGLLQQPGQHAAKLSQRLLRSQLTVALIGRGIA